MKNNLSEVIKKLQEIKDNYGDIPVFASTQDGADYDVIAENIKVITYIDNIVEKRHGVQIE